MKKSFLLALLTQAVAPFIQAQTFLDLKPLFNADAVLESGGMGVGNALDGDGRRIDAATLPAGYADGSIVTTQEGKARFQFAPFKQPSLDAMVVNGQILDVPDQKCASLDLALLAAPGAFGYPLSLLEFRYADGSKETQRLGPVASWLGSPTAFESGRPFVHVRVRRPTPPLSFRG